MNDIFVLPLTNSDKIAIIDAEDAPRLMQRTWRLENIPAYVATGRNSKLHRMLRPDIQPPDIIDHINRNRLDNRKSNLRLADSALNNHNRKKLRRSSSKFRGVMITCEGHIKCGITAKRKQLYQGYFNSEVEAALAYNFWAVHLYGDNAYLNDIHI